MNEKIQKQIGDIKEKTAENFNKLERFVLDKMEAIKDDIKKDIGKVAASSKLNANTLGNLKEWLESLAVEIKAHNKEQTLYQEKMTKRVVWLSIIIALLSIALIAGNSGFDVLTLFRMLARLP